MTTLDNFGVDLPEEPDDSEPADSASSDHVDDADDAIFSGEIRGRIKHHAIHDSRYRVMLRCMGVTGPTTIQDFEADIASAQEFVDWFDTHGDFLGVDGVGPATNERLEAAVPLVRDALQEADDAE